MAFDTLPWLILLPFIVLSVFVITLFLVISFKSSHRLVYFLSNVGLITTLLSAAWIVWGKHSSIGIFALSELPIPWLDLLIFDRVAFFEIFLVILGSIASCAISYDYVKGDPNHEHGYNKESFYLLILLATLGAMTLCVANHFATLFIGIELLSVPLYALIGYRFRSTFSLEASIKYTILSAMASGFLLFGLGMWFLETGVMSFSGLKNSLTLEAMSLSMVVAMSMILVGFGFKLSWVPFHSWTADVYQGSPNPSFLFLSTVSKVAVFAVFTRLVVSVIDPTNPWFQVFLSVIAVGSILVGNLLGLLQTNLKRLLAYSSIAHFGYISIAILASDYGLAQESILMYLLVYLLANIGIIGIMSYHTNSLDHEDSEEVSRYQGLFWVKPVHALVMTLMFLSLAGIPMTAGFIAKFMIVTVGVDAKLWFLVFTMLLGSAIGVYYYLRVIIALYVRTTYLGPSTPSKKLLANFCIYISALLILGLGIYPAPVMDMIQALF